MMRPGPVLRLVAVLATIFLSVPTAIILTTSLSSGRTIVFPPQGVTLAWYRELAGRSDIWYALLHSLYIGAESVLLGILVGVPLTLAIYRYGIRGKAFLRGYVSLGFTTPFVVSGIAFFVLFLDTGIAAHLTSVGLAVSIVDLPFMIWSVSAAVLAQNPELDDAAAICGAEEIQRFLFVTLPGIASGILVGSLLMFISATTDFVVSLLLVNANDITLPVLLFSGLRETVSPIFAAVAALYILIAAVACVVVVRVGGIEQFLFRSHQ